MKLKINPRVKKEANKAGVTKALLKRIEEIAIGHEPNLSDLYQKDAQKCLEFLRRLKSHDERMKDRIKPDKEGWYKSIYVMPEDNYDVEIEHENGYQGPANFDSGWWFLYDDASTMTITGVKRWRAMKGEPK